MSDPTLQDNASPPSQGQGSGLKGLARRLVADGLLSAEESRQAEQAAHDAHMSLLQYVVEKALVPSQQACVIVAWEYGIPAIDLDALTPESLPPAERFSEELLRKHKVLPLKVMGNRLLLAIP